MKSFKQFLDSLKKSILHFPSSFGEQRELKKRLREFLEDLTNQDKKSGVFGIDSIHEHPDVEAAKLSKDHREAIHHYTGTESADEDHGHASSGNMNAYLRNAAGDKKSKIRGGHSSERVRSSIERLSSAFTPNNTNRVAITTYGSVPQHIGQRLMNAGTGSEHHLPGFTSTSTRRSVADNFAFLHTDSSTEDPEEHQVIYHLHPGSGLSIARHAHPEYMHENEVLLNRGSRITYQKTEPVDHSRGVPRYVHHVEVHPDQHLPMPDHGAYT